MRFAHRSAIVVAVALCSAALAHAGSPLYESWAKYKPGTSVVTRGVTELPGMRSEMEQTFTLKEVTAEKVVLEMKSSVIAMGNKTDMPATTVEIPVGTAATPPAGQPPAGAGDVKRSEDKITIAGRVYTATCIESTADRAGMKATTKVWTNPEIPGMTMKTETTTAGTTPTSVKTEITSLDLK